MHAVMSHDVTSRAKPQGLSVSVIVPAFNAEDTLAACLAAIGRMSYPAAELIVFSDGSTDRTAAIAEAAGARVIRNEGPSLGPAHGRNIAAEQASGDLLLFVDADVVIGEECLERLVAELEEHGAAAAFASYDNAPASTRVAGLYANLRHHFVHQNSTREATTFWSGVGLIERQVFLDIGGYDAVQFAHPSIEDVELGMRLKANGHRIRLVPEAQAKHCKDWTLWRVWHTDIVRRALPWTRLLLDGKSDGADLNLSTAERVKALASVGTFAALIVGLFVPWALVLAAVLLGFYLYLNRQFIGVLVRNLSPSQWPRAVALHLCYHAYSLGAYGWVVASNALRGAVSPARGSAEGPVVRFDRGFLLSLAALTVLFSWALLFHGRPAYFDDTAAYLSGGQKIFERIFEVLGIAGASAVADAAAGGTAAEAGSSGGPRAIRSLPYYVLTYLLRAPGDSLFLLALFQSAVAAFYVVLHCRLERVRTMPTIFIGLILALATPIALVTVFAVPDIFAVPVISGIALLATRFERMVLSLRIVLVLLTGLAVSTHVSHPPLALAVTGAAVLWLAWAHRTAIHRAGAAMLLAGLPLVMGMAATMVGGLAGFGEASVAPKRLPLVLARSMTDGPGRWYLEEHCPTQQYAVCEIWPDGNFPRDVGPILFQEGGIVDTASEEQLERMREEEAEIVANAALAYPWFQVGMSLASIGRQFVTFKPVDINFNREFFISDDGTLRVTRADRNHAWPITLADRLAHWFIPIAALLLLAALPLMPRNRLPIVLLCLLGIVANMVICAMFSAVAGRYAMRVVWLVPLLAALYAWTPLRAFVTNLWRPSRSAEEPRPAGLAD